MSIHVATANTTVKQKSRVVFSLYGTYEVIQLPVMALSRSDLLRCRPALRRLLCLAVEVCQHVRAELLHYHRCGGHGHGKPRRVRLLGRRSRRGNRVFDCKKDGVGADERRLPNYLRAEEARGVRGVGQQRRVPHLLNQKAPV